MDGGHLPGVFPVQQHAAAVETDDLDEGLAGGLEEVGRSDGTVQDAEGARHAFEEKAHLRRLKEGEGTRTEGQFADGTGTVGRLVEGVNAVAVGGQTGQDADGTARQHQGERCCPVRPRRRAEWYPHQGRHFQGHLAGVADADAAAGQGSQQEVAARDIVLVVLGSEDQPGGAGLSGGYHSVRRRLPSRAAVPVPAARPG